MLKASDIFVAAKFTIYAQKDSISPGAAAAYGRMNAVNAAGGPLLVFMGAANLDEVRALPPDRFAVRFLRGLDSLASLRDPHHPTRGFRLVGNPNVRDSVATQEFVLLGDPSQTLHLVLRDGAWMLADDGLRPLLELAAR